MSLNQPPGSSIDPDDPIIKQILNDNISEIRNYGWKGLIGGLVVGVTLQLGLKKLGYNRFQNRFVPKLIGSCLCYGIFGAISAAAWSGK